MHRRGIVVTTVVAALALGAAGDAASAKAWPTPAAGESASGGPEILFTFDDGPNPKNTPLVLDILARHHIRAVFFMVGEMAGAKGPRAAALIQRILREGHVIATHTMKHKDLCRVAEEAAVRDLDDGKATVEHAAGIPTAWFRAPFGVRCERVERLLAARSLAHFHWDLDPQEWKKGDPGRVVKYVTGELGRSSGRNVLLMHDIKQVTVQALPEILAWIDAENARREKARRKPIRIVQAPGLAIERLPRGLVAWLGDATAGVRALPDQVARVIP